VTADMLPWIVAAVSLTVLLVAVVAMVRGQRQLQVAHEESIATKNEQISTLETQISSLRESESVRFVDRYVAAKKGLEERTVGLQERLDSAREQEELFRGQLNDLGLSNREREIEAARLHSDLNRATDQIRRLELVLREVASVGPMDVEPIRTELDGRRELSVHIRERLDRLSMQEQDRLATRRSLTHKLERLNEDAAQVRRDIEITRAASSIMDGILGIDSDTRKRLARHASEHLDGALESLGDAARSGPISRFVEILEQQRPNRLLERGQAAAPAEDMEGEAPAPPRPSPAPEPRIEPRRAESQPAPNPFWTPVP
jgi:chromosome segregation ATPase